MPYFQTLPDFDFDSFKMKAKFLTKIGHLLKRRKVQPGVSLRL